MEAWAVVEYGKPLEKITGPIPEPTGTEVVVEVTHCGVCHSDVHFWGGLYDLGGGKRFHRSERGATLPRAVGHEIVGKVIKLGPGAEGVEIGSRQIVYPWLGCGNCRRCEQNEDNLCTKQKSLGVIQHGGFASHVVVPHPKYLVDPGKIDSETACTFACSGITALSAINKIMPLAPDEAVVLIGTGGLGLAAIAVLRALGHQNIIAVEVKAESRAAALKTGASIAIDGSLENACAAANILKATGGPVLGVLDFVNNSKTAPLALSVLHKGGKMVQFGIMGGEMDLSLAELIFKAVTIVGNMTGSPDDLGKVVSLAREGKLLPIPITTMSWDNANEALMKIRDGCIIENLMRPKGRDATACRLAKSPNGRIAL